MLSDSALVSALLPRTVLPISALSSERETTMPSSALSSTTLFDSVTAFTFERRMP